MNKKSYIWHILWAALALLLAGGVLCAILWFSRYHERIEQKIKEAEIQERSDQLKNDLLRLQKRTVTIQIDNGSSNVSTEEFSMTDFQEKYFYCCSDGTEIPASDVISNESDVIPASPNGVSGAASSKAGITAVALHMKDDDTLSYSIRCEASEDAVESLLGDLAEKYTIPVQNARINAKLKVNAPKDGQKLDPADIKSELTGYLNGSSAESLTVTWNTTPVKPEWNVADLKKVHFFISRFTTHYVNTGSRSRNIALAAKRINGICLLPGESVSFEKAFYDDSDGKSYEKANAIFKGKIVQAEGGGICQVSSTAYITCLKAGILPTERHPHSLPVRYVPLGLDAAISVGNKDLVVKNTLDAPILFRAEASGGTLTVEIISAKNALKGRSYVPRAKQLSAKSARSYLDVYQNGKRIKVISLGKDTYD